MGEDFGPLAVIALLAAFFALRLVTGIAEGTRRRSRSRPNTHGRPAATPRRSRAVVAAFSGRAWIIDGDTMDVDGVRIRMFGLDAPEMSQNGGAAAKRHLIRLVSGREVHVAPLKTDIYGRTVARTFCGETDLSMAMVRDGYAVASRFERCFATLEWRARLARRGLWAKDRAAGISDPAAHRRAMRWRTGRGVGRIR